MITLEHIGLYVLAIYDGVSNNKEFEEKLNLGIPWVLIPDAIQNYIGSRQMSHFEITPDGTDVSWMEFPEEEILKELTEESAHEVIRYHMYDLEKYPKCAVGERTIMKVFDSHNYWHNHYSDIKIHLVQDCVLDEVVRRKLVYVNERYEDKYIVRNNQENILNGMQFREELKAFEMYGFTHLVGKVYKKTGILLNQDWFKKHVLRSLEMAYPMDLAQMTYNFMKIPDNIESKINELKFESNERFFDLSGSDLVSIWDKIYAKSFVQTKREL